MRYVYEMYELAYFYRISVALRALVASEAISFHLDSGRLHLMRRLRTGLSKMY